MPTAIMGCHLTVDRDDAGVAYGMSQANKYEWENFRFSLNTEEAEELVRYREIFIAIN